MAAGKAAHSHTWEEADVVPGEVFDTQIARDLVVAEQLQNSRLVTRQRRFLLV